jgi:hypothetical protein
MFPSDAYAALRAVAEHVSALPVMRGVRLPGRHPIMREVRLPARHPVMRGAGLPAGDPVTRDVGLPARHPVTWPDATSVEPSHARLLSVPAT